MKVFLSWSGTQSHQVAMVLRDWLPSVIQDIDPYVSSEDIDKGARWSTDIATELQDSAFGILCVTRENLYAPWLTFEAGALSKAIDKSFVSPFLFDIKRSEVDGPILQFQSTIFEKDDIKKLVVALNKACAENGISEERLNKAFEVWYPSLQDDLGDIQKPVGTDNKKKKTWQNSQTQEILEEILDLSRSNQKLLRSPEGATLARLEEQQSLMQHMLHEQSRAASHRSRRRYGGELLVSVLMMGEQIGDELIAIQMGLSILRDEWPWIYDAGMETIHLIKTSPRKTVGQALDLFERIVEFSIEHPLTRDSFTPDVRRAVLMIPGRLRMLARGGSRRLSQPPEL